MRWCGVVVLGYKGYTLNKTPNDNGVQINIKNTQVKRDCVQELIIR